MDTLQLTDRNFILSQEGFFFPLKTHTYKETAPPINRGAIYQKAGSRYVTDSGNVKMLDRIERVIIMTDRTKIPIEDIRYIEGELFSIFAL